MQVDVVRTVTVDNWSPAIGKDLPEGVEGLLEGGCVLFFPNLTFDFGAGNNDLISQRWADGKAKNISYRGDDHPLRGAQGNKEDLLRLKGVLAQYAAAAESLIKHLCPHYVPHLKKGFTSYRTASVEGRKSSWRKDDSRLHLDAFPSNPTGGKRLLRVFSNVNPNGVPRVWRVGEAFQEHATRFLPQAAKPFPGSARLMNYLGITKSLRTEYDHYMNQLHDLSKADLVYQRESPQQSIAFPPGSTWIVYSDQVLHAVMSGQYMMEQTFYLEPEHLLAPATSPLRVLENMLRRPLA